MSDIDFFLAEIGEFLVGLKKDQEWKRDCRSGGQGPQAQLSTWGLRTGPDCASPNPEQGSQVEQPGNGGGKDPEEKEPKNFEQMNVSDGLEDSAKMNNSAKLKDSDNVKNSKNLNGSGYPRNI